MMELKFLPLRIKNVIETLDVDKLYEIRFRVNQPIKINFNGKYKYLLNSYNEKIFATNNDFDEIIKKVTEYSLYAYNEKIKNGYLYALGGVRLGLCGECVFDNEKIITIKNITSINLRVPHNISGCSNTFFDKLVQGSKIYNTLIISPPFYGKTTMLKDVAYKLNNLNLGNILIIDERGEFTNVQGENIDKITFCNKSYAFEYGVRVMSPSIVIADELVGENDWNYVYNACKSGVSIIASAHGSSIDDVINKSFFNNKVFERYVVISEKIGTVSAIYDKNISLI
ncbi:MAG: hypothetical protein E7340_03090 [Clostridiales bacterium]|nr:hypothetical protein [Clostridiales bacterium]